ncbi:Flagellar regulatory protein FleQ [Chondromyces apiculatus DSM 436]|uniref:Flagellar regulatory protein FleQ n=2 Tax=Chondromyces apiculatus TaxID=51 RepID=A0A017T3N2_9BACT|nr:Flagellar regulatory protein FleQ [Chondromyces apiculatus DSM 436]
MQMHAGPAPTSSERGRPGLVLLYAPNFEKLRAAYPLTTRELVIGRDPRADISLPEGAASRLHARIREEPYGWVISDLGGRNGTLVNGAFVAEAPLAHLDQVRIGDAIFQFVSGDAERYAHHRIDGAYLTDATPGASEPRLPFSRIVGGYQIQRLAMDMREIARSSLGVLILGETGTGKEVFAQQLHDWSGRRGPFQAINCAAIPASLIEGELFGHRRGAFSGADRDRTGLIRAAHGGTLFLDEIGDMPVEAQAKLLRVLQSKEVTPLGASQPERVDVRIVSATHRDVVRLQQSGAFRADLYARLNEYSLTLPPLRHRKEDVYALCLALAARHGKPEPKITLPAMAALLHHDFPFNVRELEAILKRWAAAAKGSELGVEHLSDEIQKRMRTYGQRPPAPSPAPPDPRDALDPRDAPGTSGFFRDAPGTSDASPDPRDASGYTAPTVRSENRFASSSPRPTPPPPEPAEAARRDAPSEQQLRDLLAAHQGNVAAVARILDKDRTQIHRWLRRYGIKVDDYR